MTDRQATIAECLAVAEATSESRAVKARDVWIARSVVMGQSAEASELRDWRDYDRDCA